MNFIVEDAAESLLENMLAGNVPQIERAAKATWETWSPTGWSDATESQQHAAVIATIEAVARRLADLSYATGVAGGAA